MDYCPVVKEPCDAAAKRQKRVREHRLLQGSMMHHRADDRARGMEDAEDQGKMQAWRKEKTTQHNTKISGGDASRGNTRSHPEHEG